MSMVEHDKKWRAEQEQEKRWLNWRVSPQELVEYKQLFRQVDDDHDGFITGRQARAIFAGTGLAMDVLGKIWSLADRDGDQKLNPDEYALALFLIKCKQRGELLPSYVPLNLLQSVFKDLNAVGPPHPVVIHEITGVSELSTVSAPIRIRGYDTVPEFTENLRGSLGTSIDTSDTFSTRGPYEDMPSPVSSIKSLPLDLEEAQERKRESPYGQPILTNTNGRGSNIFDSPVVSGVLTDRDDDRPPPPPEWVEYQTNEGKKYYFDKTTKKTTWNRPEELNPRVANSASNSYAPPPPMIETTQSLMNDPAKVEFFKQFLESESANSEILFYMDIENFKQHVPTKEKELLGADILRAEAIYAKYIKKNAIFKVNMSARVKKEIKKYFKDGKGKKGEIHGEIFNEAQQEMVQLIEKEQLPRFMKSMFYITMYNSMTHRTPYELPDQLWKEILVCADGTEAEGWEYVTEKKGVLVHRKRFSGNQMICIRGSGVIPIPPEEVFVFTVSIELRSKWDLISAARVVERLDDKTVICQYKYDPPKLLAAMFDPHDFLILRTERREPDGTIIVLSRSVVHKDAPVERGTTRDEIDVTGFIIRPCGATSSVVIYVNQASMAGIPKWAEESYINRRPLMLSKMRKFVEKELKDKKKVPSWRREEFKKGSYEIGVVKLVK